MTKFDSLDDWQLYHYIIKRINRIGIYWDTRDYTLWKPLNNISVPFTIAQARDILSKSTSGDPDEEEMVDIMNYYWGYVPKDLRQKPEGRPKIDQAICRSHVWIDVLLFNITHRRCLYCDIKQTSVEDK